MGLGQPAMGTNGFDGQQLKFFSRIATKVVGGDLFRWDVVCSDLLDGFGSDVVRDISDRDASSQERSQLDWLLKLNSTANFSFQTQLDESEAYSIISSSWVTLMYVARYVHFM